MFKKTCLTLAVLALGGLSHRLAAGAGRPEIPAQPAYGEYG